MFVMLIFAPFYSITVVTFVLSSGEDCLSSAAAAVASPFCFYPFVLFGVFFVPTDLPEFFLARTTFFTLGVEVGDV